MKALPWRAVAVALLCMTVLVGCAPAVDEPKEGSNVSLEEAKAEAQSMELEIVSLIPDDVVASIDQKPTGVLLSCDETQHNWNGSTTVTLTPASNAERIVKDLETRLEDDDRFDSRNWIDPTGAYNVQLMSPSTAANFIFGEDEPHTIRIASGSVCFTLPEGVYPGGKF